MVERSSGMIRMAVSRLHSELARKVIGITSRIKPNIVQSPLKKTSFLPNVEGAAHSSSCGRCRWVTKRSLTISCKALRLYDLSLFSSLIFCFIIYHYSTHSSFASSFIIIQLTHLSLRASSLFICLRMMERS